MNFARWTFRIAGIYGVVALLPQYFLEEKIGRDFPPAITHPAFFYGFLGVALAWQFAFLVIATDPPRYRPIMLAGVFEKLSFGIAAIVLYSQGRLASVMLGAGMLDLVFAVLFVIAWAKTAPRIMQQS
jgi:hypothetical protein